MSSGSAIFEPEVSVAEPRHRPQVPEFHFLRAVACTGVVTIHVLTVLLGYVPPGHTASGILALQMLLMFSTPAFVFLSALLLGFSYSTPPPDFIRKRCRYLLVPFILMNLVYAAFRTLIAWLGNPEEVHFAGQLVNEAVKNLAGGSHLWFIIPIFQFYIVFAVAAAYLYRARAPILLGAALLINAAYLLYFHVLEPQFPAYEALVGKHWYSFAFLAWVFYFAVGLRAGAAYASFQAMLRRRIVLISFLAVVAGLVVLGLHFSRLLWDISSKRADVVLYALLVGSALLYAGTRFRNMPGIIVTLSRLSFGIYLLHPLFIELLWRGVPLGMLPLPGAFLLLMATGLLAPALATAALGRTEWGTWFVGRIRRSERGFTSQTSASLR
jgi:membrane-bound acyltransferase YfiQ involved in biofilm formation